MLISVNNKINYTNKYIVVPLTCSVISVFNRLGMLPELLAAMAVFKLITPHLLKTTQSLVCCEFYYELTNSYLKRGGLFDTWACGLAQEQEH